MAPKVNFNTELLRQEQYAKMRAGYGAVPGSNSTTAFTAQPKVAGTPTLSPSDMARINGIAERNALKGKGVSPATEAAAGTSSAPSQVAQTSTTLVNPTKVNSKQAISFNNGVRTETSDALRFNARMASLNYAQTAEKSKNMGEFTPLKNSKISASNMFAQVNTAASNPFAGQYTGLSFKFNPNDIIA